MKLGNETTKSFTVEGSVVKMFERRMFRCTHCL